MGIGSLLTRGIGAVITSCTGRILSDEFQAWTPVIASLLLRGAVKCMPQEDRERCSEEWASDLSETPGSIGKIVFSLGLYLAAFKIQATLPRAKKKITPKGKMTITVTTVFNSSPVRKYRSIHSSQWKWVRPERKGRP